MKILREFIRETLLEYDLLGVTVTGGVDPTKKDEPANLGLDADVERLRKGFYPSPDPRASYEEDITAMHHGFYREEPEGPGGGETAETEEEAPE